MLSITKGVGRRNRKVRRDSMQPKGFLMEGIVCCIYHKPRRFDESSDESDSDSDSDSSSVCGGNHNYNHSGHNHQLQAGSSSHGQQLRSDSGSGVVHELERPIESEPNAYEKQPKGKRKGVPPRYPFCSSKLSYRIMGSVKLAIKISYCISSSPSPCYLVFAVHLH